MRYTKPTARDAIQSISYKESFSNKEESDLYENLDVVAESISKNMTIILKNVSDRNVNTAASYAVIAHMMEMITIELSDIQKDISYLFDAKDKESTTDKYIRTESYDRIDAAITHYNNIRYVLTESIVDLMNEK